jgi:hypothetical protein
MKLKHFSLLFSILGVLLLYFISELSQPPFIEIQEMSSYEGKQVVLEGTVLSYRTTNHGGQIITVSGNNSTATIFLEGNIDAEYGDRIQATGEVQKYKDEWELIVNNNRFVKILQKWQNISNPLWQLAENPSRYLGLNINVSGHVESISNAYFYLVDIEEKHSLIVFYKLSENITIHPGQKVSVLGKFTFDEENFRYQLELSDEKHGITPLGRE